ncbi:MAG: UDP-2,3-diacylglucosamine diphosphatase [Longimicrobiales bacterium]|nr:UDP-2,3-diacylglucosamine diphosphatase [Longimicrobiales bacterium]
MSEKPVYLASDVHLGAAPPRNEAAFLAWLRHTADVASHVVINGDLFDFWFEYRRGIPQGHEEVLAVLRELVGSGLPVTLMGGNHDWWGGRYLREVIGVEFLQEPVVRTYAGRITFLAHGDGLGDGDLRYRALKLVLRGGATRHAFGLLGPGLGGRVAGRVSRTRERWGEPTRDDRTRAEVLAAWAREKLATTPELDLVVLGHTHLPSLAEVEVGRWYLNAGDWVRHNSYAVLATGSAPRLLTWEG